MASRVNSQSETVHWGQITTGKTQGSNTPVWRCVCVSLCVWVGVESHDFLKTETNAWREKGGETREEDAEEEEEKEGGRVWGWCMASPCCCCGRWWPAISVLSLSSDGPDNQWALLGGAGAKPCDPPNPPPSADACVHVRTQDRKRHTWSWNVCVCVCVWVMAGPHAMGQGMEIVSQASLLSDTHARPGVRERNIS